jgi:hypothetical protein
MPITLDGTLGITTTSIDTGDGQIGPAGATGFVGATGTISATIGYFGSVLINGKAPGQPQYDIFPSSGTWTCPPGVTRAKITVFGGGSGCANYSCGARGGDGGAGWNYFTVTPGTTYTVTIGNGTAGVTSGSSTAAGTTSFGALISATGGGAAASASDGIAGTCANALTNTTNFIRLNSGGQLNYGIDIYGFGGYSERTGTGAIAWSASLGIIPGSKGVNSLGSGGGVGGVALVEYIG